MRRFVTAAIAAVSFGFLASCVSMPVRGEAALAEKKEEPAAVPQDAGLALQGRGGADNRAGHALCHGEGRGSLRRLGLFGREQLFWQPDRRRGQNHVRAEPRRHAHGRPAARDGIRSDVHGVARARRQLERLGQGAFDCGRKDRGEFPETRP